MSAILELRHISKRFGPTHAVEDVSLSVERGEFFALLGPSGCGKTTLLRTVAGFEQPDEGDVLLLGERINHLQPYERNVSTVFQSYALFPHLTAVKNVEFGLHRKQTPAVELRQKVADVFDLLRLTGKEDRLPSQLSGGERQRVALARSLVLQPGILLLDEPLSALDPNLRKQVRSELKELQRSTATTFIFVTHDQEEALSLSDRIAVLYQGRLQQVDTPQQLYLHPQTRFVAGFLGGVNWMGAIGVRPEATRLSRIKPAATSLQAVIHRSTFLGSAVHVEAKLVSGETIVSEVSRVDDSYTAGETVHVWWNPADEMRPAQ